MKKKSKNTKRIIVCGMRRYRLWLGLVIVMAIAVSGLTACSSPTASGNPNDSTDILVDTPVIESNDSDGYLQEKAHFQIDDEYDLVYLRVKVVANWQKEDGTVYFSMPVQDVDYTLDVGPTIWERKDDGFYYYPNPMLRDDDLPDFHVNYKLLSEPPTSEYTLKVSFVTQAVPVESLESITE